MDLGDRKQRLVLAVLLLECNQLVPIDRLVDLLWRDRPPPSARRTVQSHLSRLRTVLSGVGGGAEIALVRSGSGYVLACDPEYIDAHLFRQLLERSRRGRDDEDRVRLLQQALRLWRGPALADVATGEIRDELCRGLDEARLAATEERLDAELELGRGRQLVDELTGLAARHPYRQPFVSQLMLALHHAGRASEALGVYTRARQRLRSDLGLEPAAELSRLQLAILRGDPVLQHRARTASAPQAAASVPAQLPADVPEFVGRTSALQWLGAGARCVRSTAPSIAVITGGPGIGKTSLAVHWAQQNADQFRDGQLYTNLQGHAADAPVRPEEALRSMLHALGTEANLVPGRLAEAAALYRSKLAGRRVIVVLDDASTAEQVRPLLPGSPTCAVVVTSRRRLDGLVAIEGARQLAPPVLSAPEAEELLRTTCGADGTRTDPQALAELAKWCGYLPLALRIAAAKLAGAHHSSVSAYVARVASRDPLDELRLAADEFSVRSAFDRSYVSLAQPVRRLFRMLGAVPASGCPVAAVAVFGGVVAANVDGLLGQLTDANLVERHDDDRITVPPLLRWYAERKLAEEDGPERRSLVRRRLLQWYLDQAEAVLRAARPRPDAGSATGAPAVDRAGSVDWLEAERASLAVLVAEAADQAITSPLVDRLARVVGL